MVDKVNNYNVTPTDVDMAGQGDGDLFKAGKIAMLRTGIWMFGDFSANAKFNWDIALEPGNTNKAHHFFANGVAVSATSANQQAAYEWIKFLTSSKEAVDIRIKAGWELPAVSDPAYVQGYLDQPKPESREVVFQALDTAVTPPVIDNWNQLTDIVGKELEAAKLGQKTPRAGAHRRGRGRQGHPLALTTASRSGKAGEYRSHSRPFSFYRKPADDHRDASPATRPLWESHPWFFELYATLLDDPRAAEAAIADRLASRRPIRSKPALALFLAGTHRRPHRRRRSRARAPTAPSTQVADRAASARCSPANNGFSDTWVLALWAGALRLANLVLQPRRPHAARRARQEPRLCQPHRRRHADVVVRPHDARLRRAARRRALRPVRCRRPRRSSTPPRQLADAPRTPRPAERQMLAWYFGEQGSYAKAPRPHRRRHRAHADRAQAAQAHRPARCALHPPSRPTATATATSR